MGTQNYGCNGEIIQLGRAILLFHCCFECNCLVSFAFIGLDLSDLVLKMYNSLDRTSDKKKHVLYEDNSADVV